jgi:hypothetical protein
VVPHVLATRNPSTSDEEEDLVQETLEATLVAAHQYMFERHDQELVVFVFMAIFVSYCPQFWGSEVIYKAHDTEYMFERHDKKLAVFAFMAVFVSYCPLFWGSGGIYMAHDTQYMFERHDQKLVMFTFLGRFREL